jgi:hypothetical protein
MSFKLRADFESSMKGWVWYTRLEAPLDVDEGASSASWSGYGKRARETRGSG